jgi:cytidylate kinase
VRSGFRRFVRATLALTSGRQMAPGARAHRSSAGILDEPRLSITGEPRLVPSSAGGANLVARVTTHGGPHILKARVDTFDTGADEARTLRRAGPDIAPSLVFSTTPAALVTLAMRRARLSLIPALDVPLGGVLYTSFVDGTHPTRLDDAVIARTARALATLWSRKSDDLAPLRAPSSPQGLLRLLESTRRAIDAQRLLDAPSRRLVERAEHAVRANLERALDEGDFERVRALCHGDLRWHNLLDDKERIRFIDFEHAGRGDPALDLAMMTARTPLSLHVEHALLDEVLAHRRDRTFLDRYFGIRPLVALIAGLSALHDLALVLSGDRVVEGDREAYVRTRSALCLEELREAVDGALVGTRPFTKPLAKLRVRLPVPAKAAVRARRTRVPNGVIAVDGTAASGKSVLAAILAASFDLPHWNTGAVYRAIALAGLTDDTDPSDARAVARLTARLRRHRLFMTDDGGVSSHTHTPFNALALFEVDRVVAQFAQHATVRSLVDEVLERTRERHRVRAVLIEGRDVSTVLARDARVRFFVDAKSDVRAARVHERILLATAAHRVPRAWRDPRDTTPTLAAVARATIERDQRDRTRTLAPMVMPSDAVVIDTTTGSGEENAQDMVPHILSRHRSSLRRPLPRARAISDTRGRHA